MRRLPWVVVALALALVFLPASQGRAQTLPANCTVVPASVPAPQLVLVCVPPPGVPWNGDAVIYAHGYVAPAASLEAAWLQLTTPGGTSIPGLLTQLGFLFAAPTYRKTGLAVKEGLADATAVAFALKAGLGSIAPPSNRVFIVGASEGGLVAALAMEQAGTPFTAGVAACGPIGDFRRQINYFDSFRVLFDYFFKNTLPGSPVDIPADLTADWLNGFTDPFASYYQTQVLTALAAHPGLTLQLMSTAKAAFDPNDPTTMATTALRVLYYNVVGTNEAQVELGKYLAPPRVVQPFTNLRTWYFGSTNDLLLNASVERIPLNVSEATLAQALQGYQTTGGLQAPLVTIHNIYDPDDPIWHQALYRAKVWLQGRARLYNGIPINRYGHCNFTEQELLYAFGLAYTKGTGTALSLSTVVGALSPWSSLQSFQELMQQYGTVAR